ncbi:MAG: lysozyme [Candidatus Berkelbacteria bacterium]
MRQITANGVKLIQTWEGCRLQAYPDTGGVWTIGYGTTKYPSGKMVKKTDKITMQQAVDYLRYEIRIAESFVSMKVRSVITPEMFDALVSFTYNVGVGAFYKSSLLRAVNLWPENPDIEELFLRWRYDNGKEIQGLINRRKSEAHYYRTGEIITDFTHAPAT